MLRSLDMNEMDLVSGGTEDEVIVTGTIQRRERPVYIMPNIVDGSEYLQSLGLEGSGGIDRNSDAFLLWLHAGNNVGITPVEPSETSTADDGSTSFSECVFDSANAGAGAGGAIGSTIGGSRAGWVGRIVGDAAGNVIGGVLGGAFGAATCVP